MICAGFCSVWFFFFKFSSQVFERLMGVFEGEMSLSSLRAHIILYGLYIDQPVLSGPAQTYCLNLCKELQGLVSQL